MRIAITAARRALAAILSAVVLVGAAGCPSQEDEPGPRVWAVDVAGGSALVEAVRVGGRDEVTMWMAFYATVCAPEAHLDATTGSYGHDACSYPFEYLTAEIGTAGWSQGEVDELDRKYPQLQVKELTVTATVQIVAESLTSLDGDRTPVGTVDEVQIGPLRMYEAQRVDPVVWRFDPLPGAAGSGGRYLLHAKVKDCRLSNGSACGNNSQPFEFFPSDGIGNGEQGLGAAGLIIPDGAGGLPKIELGSGQEGGRTAQPGQNPSVGGVPVRRTVQGLFQAGPGLGRVHFWGVEFSEPAPSQAIAAATITGAFGLGVTSGSSGLLVPRSELRQYDPGPLGGQVWCQTFDNTLAAQTSYACGWVDQSTVGTISVGHDAIEDLELTEADAAALLVQMRGDIEAVS